MKRDRKIYDSAFKAKAVQLSKERTNVSELARELGIAVTLLVCAVELTDEGNVKRFYALKINDFSSISLQTIFDKHIDKSAQIVTDGRKGYRPIKNLTSTKPKVILGKIFWYFTK
ncbi:transposase [Chryseobacterium cucumeris]|nr:transposase [Chryseobacterium cucumeris]